MNVNGRDPVLNSGPLSRRPDKSSTNFANFIVKFEAQKVGISCLMQFETFQIPPKFTSRLILVNKIDCRYQLPLLVLEAYTYKFAQINL
jgi:hypothetical protein